MGTKCEETLLNDIAYVLIMMMVLCLKAGSLAFTPPGDEMGEVVCH